MTRCQALHCPQLSLLHEMQIDHKADSSEIEEDYTRVLIDVFSSTCASLEAKVELFPLV